jgi:hypothetical protein
MNEAAEQSRAMANLRENNRLFEIYTDARDAVVKAAEAHAKTKRATLARRATFDQLKVAVAKMNVTGEAYRLFAAEHGGSSE